MKVAIFTDAFTPQINGVTETLVKLMNYMDTNNIEYRIFAPVYGRDTEDSDTKAVIRLRSIRCVFYPQCRISIPKYSSIVKELDDFKPDIIHAVTSFGIGIFGFKYARDFDIPVVASYETNIPQYLDYYHLKFLTPFSWDFYIWFHNKCAKNYCPSKATLELLKEKGIANLEIWDRGVEIDRFSPVHRDDKWRDQLNIHNKLTFLYVGRVSAEKDLDIFINTAIKLNEKYMEQIHFIVVGDGPSLKDLKRRAPDNVTFTGFLRGQKLYSAYASSDVFLFPSPTETLGFVLLEALASGLPVIACNEGGIRDNLIDGFNGLACREKNEDDFYFACERMILNEGFRKELSRNARKYALDKTWSKTFDKLIASYEEVIEAKKLEEDVLVLE